MSTKAKKRCNAAMRVRVAYRGNTKISVKDLNRYLQVTKTGVKVYYDATLRTRTGGTVYACSRVNNSEPKIGSLIRLCRADVIGDPGFVFLITAVRVIGESYAISGRRPT